MAAKRLHMTQNPRNLASWAEFRSDGPFTVLSDSGWCKTDNGTGAAGFAGDIGNIRKCIRDHPGWGRRRLSNELSERWDWQNEVGRLTRLFHERVV